MLKIIKEQWDKNREVLREALHEGDDFNECNYKDLVKLAFEKIFNEGTVCGRDPILDLKNITEIDNGDYQGTLLFLIPFQTYQPCEYDYLMTYIGYGSCECCDTLQRIQDYHPNKKLTEEQVEEFMALCKDILTNTIKPYNGGWRYDSEFDQVEE